MRARQKIGTAYSVRSGPRPTACFGIVPILVRVGKADVPGGWIAATNRVVR